jgi:hypothetical protein
MAESDSHVSEGHRSSRINHDTRSVSRQARSRSQEHCEGPPERGESRKGVGLVGRSLDRGLSGSRNSERSQVLSVLRAASSQVAQGKVLSVLRSASGETEGAEGGGRPITVLRSASGEAEGAEGGGRPITSKSVKFQ